jgi:hypothetical protein
LNAALDVLLELGRRVMFPFALGEEARELGEVDSVLDEPRRKAEELDEPLVVRDERELRVEYAYALIETVEPDLEAHLPLLTALHSIH